MDIILILKLILCVISLGVIGILLREIINKKPSKYSDLQKIFEDKIRIVRGYVAVALILEIVKLIIERVGN